MVLGMLVISSVPNNVSMVMAVSFLNAKGRRDGSPVKCLELRLLAMIRIDY